MLKIVRHSRKMTEAECWAMFARDFKPSEMSQEDRERMVLAIQMEHQAKEIRRYPSYSRKS